MGYYLRSQNLPHPIKMHAIEYLLDFQFILDLKAKCLWILRFYNDNNIIFE